MKSDYFIPLLIALALCFGQLASNTHVLSHVGMPMQSGEHAESSHKHNTQAVFHANAPAADESDEEILDCAIYHLFAGSHCLTAVNNCDVAAEFECVAEAAIVSLHNPAGISDSPHIRGPPRLS